MSSSTDSFEDRPLLVVALGGNALSPPAGEPSYEIERAIIRATCAELQTLVDGGYRLLIVHGNGPQVGRLMREDAQGSNLDVYVAQTQGELGYLIIEELARAGVDNAVSLVTRVTVDPADPGLAQPSKAVGPVLTSVPASLPCRRVGPGWRLLVGSPRPLEVLELTALMSLIASHHLVAGGGGGIPVTPDGEPVAGVVDKDWVAALLAISLNAEELMFVTDVDGVYAQFGQPDQHLIRNLNIDAAQALVTSASLGVGSMLPKVESAAAYSQARARPSHITTLGDLAAALQDRAGTTISGPSPARP